jgi:RimJ/RimL family protein N-acetyltransferase
VIDSFSKLRIRPFHDADIPIMEVWLNKDYIKTWYEVPGLCSIEDWLLEIKNRKVEYRFITHFIALWDETPIGFCQYYQCSDAYEDWYGETPLFGTYSIDYLIGEEEYLRKGIGKSIIALLVREIFSLPDSKRIIVQPDEKNSASTNSLLSNGFIFDTENNVYLKTK